MIQCPYCKTSQEINHDDGYGYTEDDAHQQECVGCEKTFIFFTSISFSYRVIKADCLNGAYHDYKIRHAYEREDGRVLVTCQTCEHDVLKPKGWTPAEPETESR